MDVRGIFERTRARLNTRSTCDHALSREREDWMGADYLICEKCGHVQLTLDTD